MFSRRYCVVSCQFTSSGYINTTPLDGYGANFSWENFTSRLSHTLPQQFFTNSSYSKIPNYRVDPTQGEEGSDRIESEEPDRPGRYVVTVSPDLLEQDDADYLITMYSIAGGPQAEFSVGDTPNQFTASPVNRWQWAGPLTFELVTTTGTLGPSVENPKFQRTIENRSAYSGEQLPFPNLVSRVTGAVVQSSTRGFNYRLTTMPSARPYTTSVAMKAPIFNTPTNGPFAGNLEVGSFGARLLDSNSNIVWSVAAPTTPTLDPGGPRVAVGIDDVLVWFGTGNGLLTRQATPVPTVPGSLSGTASISSGVWFATSSSGLYQWTSWTNQSQWVLKYSGSWSGVWSWGGTLWATRDLGTQQEVWRRSDGGAWTNVHRVDLSERIIALVPANQKLWALSQGTSVLNLRDLTSDTAAIAASVPTVDAELFTTTFPSWPLRQLAYSDQGLMLGNVLMTPNPDDLSSFTLLALPFGLQVVNGQLWGSPSFSIATFDSDYPTTPNRLLDSLRAVQANPWIMELREDRPDFHQLREITPDPAPSDIQVDYQGTRYELANPLLGNYGIKGVIERNNAIYAVERTYYPGDPGPGFPRLFGTHGERLIALSPVGTLPPGSPDSVNYPFAPFQISPNPSIPFKMAQDINGTTYYHQISGEGPRSRNSGDFMDAWYLDQVNLDGLRVFNTVPFVDAGNPGGGPGKFPINNFHLTPRFNLVTYTNWDTPIRVRFDDQWSNAIPGLVPSALKTTFGANADSFEFKLPAATLDQNVGEHCVNSACPDLLRGAQVSVRQEVRLYHILPEES